MSNIGETIKLDHGLSFDDFIDVMNSMIDLDAPRYSPWDWIPCREIIQEDGITLWEAYAINDNTEINRLVRGYGITKEAAQKSYNEIKNSFEEAKYENRKLNNGHEIDKSQKEPFIKPSDPELPEKQALVNLCFDIARYAAKNLHSKDNWDISEWVQKELLSNGFLVARLYDPEGTKGALLKEKL